MIVCAWSTMGFCCCVVLSRWIWTEAGAPKKGAHFLVLERDRQLMTERFTTGLVFGRAYACVISSSHTISFREAHTTTVRFAVLLKQHDDVQKRAIHNTSSRCVVRVAGWLVGRPPPSD